MAVQTTTTTTTTTTTSTTSAAMDTSTSLTAGSIPATDASRNMVDDDVEVEGILKNVSNNVRTGGQVDSATSIPVLIDVDFHKRQHEKGII